jgi:hypothetical protein
LLEHFDAILVHHESQQSGMASFLHGLHSDRFSHQGIFDRDRVSIDLCAGGFLRVENLFPEGDSAQSFKRSAVEVRPG